MKFVFLTYICSYSLCFPMSCHTQSPQHPCVLFSSPAYHSMVFKNSLRRTLHFSFDCPTLKQKTHDIFPDSIFPFSFFIFFFFFFFTFLSHRYCFSVLLNVDPFSLLEKNTPTHLQNGFTYQTSL